MVKLSYIGLKASTFSNCDGFIISLRVFSKNQELCQGCGFGFLHKTGSRIFCPTPDVQLDHFLHHTPKFEIPVEMVQFLLKLSLKQISCCAPRSPLILTAKFHSLYVKESEILYLDILPRTPQSCLQSR